MKKYFALVLIGILVLFSPGLVKGADLEFGSFEEAEAAAKKRAEEYQKKMDEHLKQVQSDWEKQQKDLGDSGSSPDITKITSSSDGNKSSDTDAQKKMEDAVNSSVNNMKDMMIKSATPNTTGFAGGGAGYQWSVKFKNGKYILSDSYNEAAFGTGDKKDKDPKPEPADPEKEADGEDDDEDVKVAAKPEAPKAPPAAPPDSSDPGSDESPADSTAPDSSSTSADPDKTTTDGPSSSGSGSATPGTKVDDKPAPGIDPAPTKLPDPAVRLVIQHPTEFTEEVFASNIDNSDSTEFQLNKFKIPEDTRVKIALELSKEVDPNKVSLVIVDEEGKGAPVPSNKTKNYRHMFRVPSEDQYSAAVIVDEGSSKKEVLKVKIPVIKMDFDSRTIEDQRRKQGSENLSSSSSSSSSSTSHSSSDGNFSHSSFGKSQQVDLSDLYSDPSSSSGSSGGNSDGSSDSSSSSTNSSSSSSSGNSSNNQNSSSNSGSSSDSDPDSDTYGHSGTNASGGSDYNESDADGSENGQDASDSSQSADKADSSDANLQSKRNGGKSGGSSSSDGSSSGSSYGGSADSGYGSSGASSSDEPGDEAADLDGQEYAGLSQGSGKTGSSAGGQGGDSNSNRPGLSGNTANSGSESAQNEEENDPFIMALSMQAVSRKIYQSFDFIDETSPISATIPKGTEVTFSMSFSSTVDPESVRIELNDGKGKVAGDLKTWGEAFAYVFDQPAQAYFHVSGKTTQKQNFSYRLNIPVK